MMNVGRRPKRAPAETARRASAQLGGAARAVPCDPLYSEDRGGFCLRAVNWSDGKTVNLSTLKVASLSRGAEVIFSV
jgi:hypothetical protein